MQSKARHILVVRKANSDRAARLEAEIGAWLRARGHSVTAISGGFDDPAYALPDLDFAVVLGGDGTMLGVARRVAGRGIPCWASISAGSASWPTSSRSSGRRALPILWQASLPSVPVWPCNGKSYAMKARSPRAWPSMTSSSAGRPSRGSSTWTSAWTAGDVPSAQ